MGIKKGLTPEDRDNLQAELTRSYKNKVKCPACGKLDNDWKSRRGLCCDCYCFLLNKLVDIYKMTYQQAMELLASDVFGGSRTLTARDIERFSCLETGTPFRMLMDKHGMKHEPLQDDLRDDTDASWEIPVDEQPAEAEMSTEAEMPDGEAAIETELPGGEAEVEATVEISLAEEPLHEETQPEDDAAEGNEKTERLSRYMKYYRKNREKILERRRLKRLGKNKENYDEVFARTLDSAWERLQVRRAEKNIL